MGLFGFLRREDERAIPEPGSPEFEAAVQGSAIPDAQSVRMGEAGWTSQPIDLRGSGAREKVVEALRQHGIDPDKQGQQIDASSMPGLQKAILGILGLAGVEIPNAGGVAGWVGTGADTDPLAQIEHLARQRDAGQITEAEFQAHKKRLLDAG